MTFLLPTKGRLPDLRRFIDAAREMGTVSPCLIVVNRDEWERSRADYEGLCRLFPNKDWSYLPVEAANYGAALRAAWPHVKDKPWIGLLADDLVPSTANWDKQLLSSLQGWNLVYSNDGWQAPARMHGAIVFSGDLARAIGWVFPERLKHIFHDDILENLARETNCATYRGDVMMRHLHESLQGKIGPTMDRNSDLWRHDEAVFKDWMATEFAPTCERIRTLMQRFGLKILEPDFKGVSLMVGTPTIDGQYDAHYLASLFRTFEVLKARGVPAQLAEEKYTADISLARAKIFAAFLRSQATHLLMIDADMGWGQDAIDRLFCARKDVVAIAGPKKRYPISFAANYTDDQGNPIDMIFDSDSGTMEVGEIGMAFCLITRACAEKMARAYPELLYRGVTGDPEWAVFNPMIQRQRYYSEDFAFCRRWRNIGGHVHMVPDIALKHTGSHCFEGAFLKAALQSQPALLEAAE